MRARPWSLLAIAALVAGILAMHASVPVAGPSSTAAEVPSATAAQIVQPPPPADPAGCPCMAGCSDMSACQALTDRPWPPADVVVPLLDRYAGVEPDTGGAASMSQLSERLAVGLTVTTVAVSRI